MLSSRSRGQKHHSWVLPGLLLWTRMRPLLLRLRRLLGLPLLRLLLPQLPCQSAPVSSRRLAFATGPVVGREVA